MYYNRGVAERLDLDLLDDEDPFEIDDQAAHLFKHLSGRVLVVPIAPSESGEPTTCRPIGCYDAAAHLVDRYREDR